MRITCWIRKAINTHSEYVILLFPLQQWLHEIASVLLYSYVVCLVLYINVCVFMEEQKKNLLSKPFFGRMLFCLLLDDTQTHIACTPGQFNCQNQIKLV